jgi:hypothetical protein
MPLSIAVTFCPPAAIFLFLPPFHGAASCSRKVLTDYSKDMKRQLKRGYRAKERPSGHKITHKFTKQGGAIPPS